jgi:hypothetical protein
VYRRVATAKRIGNIDLSQDMVFERREWVLQRVGWVVIALLLVAALLGLLGHGPLTREQAVDINSASWLEYNSVDHYQASSQLKLHVGPGAASGKQLRVSLNQAYLERIELERVMPEPASQELGEGRVFFVFDVAEPGQPLDVAFQLAFTQFGRANAEVAVEGGPQFSFSQLVLP